jgi:hypothetical protein
VDEEALGIDVGFYGSEGVGEGFDARGGAGYAAGWRGGGSRHACALGGHGCAVSGWVSDEVRVCL